MNIDVFCTDKLGPAHKARPDALSFPYSAVQQRGRNDARTNVVRVSKINEELYR